MSGAGVVHYHSLHRPRSVPTALGPAPLVTARLCISNSPTTGWATGQAENMRCVNRALIKLTFSQLYRRVIILYIKRGHQGAIVNTRGIETAFERSVDRVIVSLFKRRNAQTLFILWSNSTYHTFYKIRRLSVVLRICQSFAIILISPYSVYVVTLSEMHTCQLFTKPWSEILSGVIKIMQRMQPHKLVAQISENWN